MRNLIPAVLLITTLATGTALADEAADRQAVMDTDREFAAYAKQHGPAAAFAEYMVDNAIWLPINGHAVRGREAIVKEMSKGPEYQLTWAPESADVSGDLAYSWGKYVVQFQDPEKGDLTGYGKYTTVWRRQSDGNWRWVLDTGNPSPPPNGEQQQPRER